MQCSKYPSSTGGEMVAYSVDNLDCPETFVYFLSVPGFFHPLVEASNMNTFRTNIHSLLCNL